MKLVGLMPVRNEAWCLGLSLRVALMWCDEVVVLLHDCADGSRDIVVDACCDDSEPRSRIKIVEKYGEWNEMEHRQSMLEVAREMNATHVAIIDADEVLTGNLLESMSGIQGRALKCAIEMQNPGQILHLPLYNLRGSITRYHTNGIWGDRWLSVAFADDPALAWTGDRFHAREPQGRPLRPYRPIAQGAGGVMHLWGASDRRLRAKHALYKITERLRWPNKPVKLIDGQYNLWRSPDDCMAMYPGWPDPWGTPWTFRETPSEWRQPYAHLMKYLDVDAEPWQEAECRKLIAKHGRGVFAGLDLFGVV
jgi:hypothetical protein